MIYANWYDNTGFWDYNGDLSWTLYKSLNPNEYAEFFVVFNTTKAGNFTNIVSATSNKAANVSAQNVTEVITKTPDKSVDPIVPDEPVEPVVPVEPDVQKVSNVQHSVLPAAGNPLIMVLLALFALAVGTLRRRK